MSLKVTSAAFFFFLKWLLILFWNDGSCLRPSGSSASKMLGWSPREGPWWVFASCLQSGPLCSHKALKWWTWKRTRASGGSPPGRGYGGRWGPGWLLPLTPSGSEPSCGLSCQRETLEISRWTEQQYYGHKWNGTGPSRRAFDNQTPLLYREKVPNFLSGIFM